MKRDDRRQKMIDMLVEEGSVSLDEFARQFDVSKMTIHRDLDDLETEGLLRKQRGGATIESSAQFESDYRYRTRKAAAEKRLIAEKAAGLIEPGMSVMLDDSWCDHSVSVGKAPSDGDHQQSIGHRCTVGTGGYHSHQFGRNVFP